MNSLIDIFIVYVTVMFTASLIRDKIVRTDTGPVPSDMRRLVWKSSSYLEHQRDWQYR